MFRNLRLRILLGMLAAAALLLTGCFQFNMHVTIHTNGSADVDMTMAASRTLLAMGTSLENGIFETKRKELAGLGFKISDYHEENMVGFRATRTINSIEEFSSLGLGDGLGLAGQEMFTVEKGAFFSIDRINAVISFGELTGEDGDMMAVLSPDMRFFLTLPVRPLEHNAASVSDDGKTMEWVLSPIHANEIRVSARAPNTGGITAAIILGVLLAAAPVVLYFRKRGAASRNGKKARAAE